MVVKKLNSWLIFIGGFIILNSCENKGEQRNVIENFFRDLEKSSSTELIAKYFSESSEIDSIKEELYIKIINNIGEYSDEEYNLYQYEKVPSGVKKLDLLDKSVKENVFVVVMSKRTFYFLLNENGGIESFSPILKGEKITGWL